MTDNQHTPQDHPETETDHHDRRPWPDVTESNLVAHLWQMLRALGVQHGRMLVTGARPAAFAGAPEFDGPHVAELVAPIPPPGWPHTGLRLERRSSRSGDEHDLVILNTPYPTTRSHSLQSTKALVDLQAQMVRTALDLTMPGGFTVALTSHRVLDAPDARHRHQFRAMADLVGAVRLPSTLLPSILLPGAQGRPDHHGSPADTGLSGMAADLLVLRRRPDGEPDRSMPFLFIAPVMIDDTPAAVNEYFKEFPQQVLGTTHLARDYPDTALVITPEPDSDRDLHAALSAVARRGTARGLTTAPSPWGPPDQGPAPYTSQVRRSPARPNPWTTTPAADGYRPELESRPDPAPPTELGW